MLLTQVEDLRIVVGKLDKFDKEDLVKELEEDRKYVEQIISRRKCKEDNR